MPRETPRAYWAGITLAYKRILTGSAPDRALAYGDYWRLTEAFVILFDAHAKLENDHLYPNVGQYLTALALGVRMRATPLREYQRAGARAGH